VTKREKTRRSRAKPDDTALPENIEEAKPDALLNYLRSRFPHIGIAVTILLGAAASLDWITNGAEKIRTVIQWFEPAKPILPYVEIVFDRSEEMNSPVGSEPETKWLAAKQAVRHVDMSNNAYLALRTFGGSCTDNFGRPDLGFAPNAKEQVNSALEKLAPGGKGNLANAVIAAMDDLVDRPPLNGINPRVVVITGSNDSCTSDQIGAIKSHQLRHPNVILDFRFIGIQLSDREKQELEIIRTETKGEVIYVNNGQDIGHALDTFLVWEPMENSVGAVIGILNDCILRLNKVVADLREPGAGTADVDFQVARDECKRSDQPFRDLGDKQQQGVGSDFVGLYQRASENRNMRERIISVMEKLIANTKSGDLAGYDLSLKEFMAVEETYNRQVADLNSVLARLKSQH
jgi:hypothetical protein